MQSAEHENVPPGDLEVDLVPVALIALEINESVEQVAHLVGEAVHLDDIGLQAVRADVARQFLADRAEQTARMQEQSRRIQEAASRDVQPVGAGVPALEGGSAFESLMQAEAVSPQQEFGRPRPDFVVEVLEECQRQQAAERESVRRRKQARRDETR